MITAPLLEGLAGVRHGFFTREGGVSDGVFASLNCGFASGDARERVAANRAIAMRRLGMPEASLAAARQVHGVDVLLARAPAPGPPSTEADALVTDRPGITLGVLAADCAPVLVADPERRVIGAAHAGWRGALDGVVEALIARMEALGGARARMRAAVGPCVAMASYEVGPEFHAVFVRDDPASDRLFAPVAGSDRRLFDLKAYVARRIEAAGVAAAEVLAHDTAADPERFFSARRARRAGDERFGLLLSAIALEA